MKKIFLIIFASLLFAATSFGQTLQSSGPRFAGNRSSDPGNCSAATLTWYYNTSERVPKYCSDTSTWSSLAGGAALGSPLAGSTPGSMLFVGPNGEISESNSNLHWDNVKKTMMIHSDQTSPDSSALRLDLQNGSESAYLKFSFGDDEASYYGQFHQVPYGVNYEGLYNLSFRVPGPSGIILGRASNYADGVTPYKVLVQSTDVSQGNLGIYLMGGQTEDAITVLNEDATKPFRVTKSGKVMTLDEFYSKFAGGGLTLTSQNGSCWKVSVSNAGALTTTSTTCP